MQTTIPTPQTAIPPPDAVPSPLYPVTVESPAGPNLPDVNSATQTHPQNGRPRSFSKNQEALYCDMLRLGLSPTDAARILHVSLQTIRRREREDLQFTEEVAQAMYASDTENYRAIAKAGKQSWRAAAWLVQHRGRDERPTRRAKPAAFLTSEAFKDMLRDMVCESVIANQVSADPLTQSRKRRLLELEGEIATCHRKGKDATNLQRIADDLTREMIKTLRMKMRRR